MISFAKLVGLKVKIFWDLFQLEIIPAFTKPLALKTYKLSKINKPSQTKI